MRRMTDTLSQYQPGLWCFDLPVNILEPIVEQKKQEVARLGTLKASAGDLALALLARGDDRDFRRSLQQPRRGNIALIAEVKKASPSAGVICPNFDPVRIAQEYERAGASCLSVLTDEKFFQGSLEDLKQVRESVRLPLLRKDFIIDARQIREAVDWGADAILLIVSILTDAQLKEFHSLATGVGLAVLVEVHDEAELERALAIDATLIGVNNRDLRTFQIDLGTTERLAKRLQGYPEGHRRVLVSESGIHTRTDVERLEKAGARAILVGESLMKNGNIATKVSEILGCS